MPAIHGNPNSFANKHSHIGFFIAIIIFSIIMGLVVGIDIKYFSEHKIFTEPFIGIFCISFFSFILAGIFDNWSIKGMW